MTDEHTKELADYRLKQARETLQEAEGLFALSLWRGTINRSYYAMFYAVLALAVLRQQVTSKHSGVLSFFDREFVKTGIFPKELSHSFHRAFESRQANDYGEIFTVSGNDAKQNLEEARKFVLSIDRYIQNIFKVGDSQ
jgi:uncharacterized protein (UPF0332 family)